MNLNAIIHIHVSRFMKPESRPVFCSPNRLNVDHLTFERLKGYSPAELETWLRGLDPLWLTDYDDRL